MNFKSASKSLNIMTQARIARKTEKYGNGMKKNCVCMCDDFVCFSYWFFPDSARVKWECYEKDFYTVSRIMFLCFHQVFYAVLCTHTECLGIVGEFEDKSPGFLIQIINILIVHDLSFEHLKDENFLSRNSSFEYGKQLSITIDRLWIPLFLIQ